MMTLLDIGYWVLGIRRYAQDAYNIQYLLPNIQLVSSAFIP